MKPKTLSATSASVFELCPARWTAEYFLKARSPGGTAADLGTAVHAALEGWVIDGHAEDPKAKVDLLIKMFYVAYHELFSDDSRLDEGVDLLKKWYNRSHPLENTVLSAEVKEFFELSVKWPRDSDEDFTVRFNYIWDRCDAATDELCDEGCCPLEVEVVDYKTVALPVTPEGLKNKIQARCYAVAAQIKYPHAKKVWVTFDLLRHDSVGTVFTRQENVAAYKYLKNLLRRILNEDGNRPTERLNNECRWCVRKQVCETFLKHEKVGGVLGMDDPNLVAEKLAELESKAAGLKIAMGELEAYLLAYMEREELLRFETDGLEVEATASRRRDVDAERVGSLLGGDIMSRYGKVTMGIIDKLLKGDELTASQKSELRQLIYYKYGEPSVKVSTKNPMDA
jgi:hypothetical protein